MKEILIFFHLLGLTVAVGGVIVSDVFFCLLKKKKNTEVIVQTFPYLSKMIWLGLFVLIISGMGLVNGESDYSDSSVFWVKMAFVLVIILDGLYLNLKITPKLLKYYSSPLQDYSSNDFSRLKTQAYISGAISFISWMAAFILGIMLE